MDSTGIRSFLAEPLHPPAPAESRAVVHPVHVTAARALGWQQLVAVAGFPSGWHSNLVKAAEARQAVDLGADEVWFSPLPEADSHSALIELVTLREACPPPLRLGIILGRRTSSATIAAAAAAGMDRIIIPADYELSADPERAAAVAASPVPHFSVALD